MGSCELLRLICQRRSMLFFLYAGASEQDALIDCRSTLFFRVPPPSIRRIENAVELASL
jgi:hypothetical protein